MKPAARRLVVKVGGSVLRTEADFDTAAAAVESALAVADQVLAVVSAMAGTTDRLTELAGRRMHDPPEDLLSSLLKTGEEHAATLLGMTLRGVGIAAEVCLTQALALRASGDRTSAEPVGVDLVRLSALLERARVLVVTGFTAQHVDGGDALLGRGGSDLTAIYLAWRLGAECWLVKDVPGLFDDDPNQNPSASRYEVAHWTDAAARGGGLIQPRALAFAAERSIPVRVQDVTGLGTTICGHVSALVSRGPSDVAGCESGQRGGGA